MLVHDPVMARENGKYHIFCTNVGIASFESEDLEIWKYTGPVFPDTPAWVTEAVPNFAGNIWAPDIVFHNGLYYLYYSVSSFGKNTSCIGVTTNVTLDSESDLYEWKDHGLVIQSVPNRDLWNAIDPNIVFDDEGTPWMAFGSFWEGLKLVQMDSSLLRIREPQVWYTLARRERSFDIADSLAGDAFIEAPFIFKKHGYYYLFVSYDHCCRGVNSDYKVMVGRSKDLTGPYLDREGKDMFMGGGTLFLEGDKDYPGIGHNSVYTFDGTDYLLCHAYDAHDDGKPILLVMTLSWDEDKWPIANTGSRVKGRYKKE
ncbi:MAG: arabinan endo-1,5-alpha-L-arabinosidase [Bacteroidales bacterium]|nr:arabinan endo-1,5-alpha-L-arabinosidase [Bacteroidales bacterium]